MGVRRVEPDPEEVTVATGKNKFDIELVKDDEVDEDDD